MSNLLPVLPTIGVILAIFASSLLVPLGFAWFDDRIAVSSYGAVLLLTAGSGLALWLATRRRRVRELQPRDGFLLVVLVWTVLPAYAMLPLLAEIPGLSVTDAYFEAMSGLTATGATALSGLDALPLSINVWRCLLHFIGGLGIVVLAVAVLPLLGVGGAQLYRTEMPGPMKDTKLTPRMAETARGLWVIYGLLWLACMLGYRWAGMSWPDAFMHACSTVGLGGFSSHDASFAYWNSARIEAVAMLFMLLSGINFTRYFMVWRLRSPAPLLRDPEARLYLLSVAVTIVVLIAYLQSLHTFASLEEAWRRTAFQVISVATTTGFASVDYGHWPLFAGVSMLVLGCFASCAGSAGGGIKMMRMMMLFKQARHELVRSVHPRVVNPLTMGGQVVGPQVLNAVLAFMLIYAALLTLLTLLMLATGLDLVTAFTAVLACVNNIGPGLGEVGPSGNFSSLTDFQTWICTFAMLAGRLELLAVLVLLTPQYWRK